MSPEQALEKEVDARTEDVFRNYYLGKKRLSPAELSVDRE